LLSKSPHPCSNLTTNKKQTTLLPKNFISNRKFKSSFPFKLEFIAPFGKPPLSSLQQAIERAGASQTENPNGANSRVFFATPFESNVFGCACGFVFEEA
jgi:hypothetical protein